MAANAGRLLGPRVHRSYTDDGGLVWRVLIDADVAAAAELSFGADSPNASTMPVRSKMRHVYGSATILGHIVKKRIPCGTKAATAYTVGGTSVTIDGQAFIVAGHIGEIMPTGL